VRGGGEENVNCMPEIKKEDFLSARFRQEQEESAKRPPLQDQHEQVLNVYNIVDG